MPMDSKKAETFLIKYWRGETTREEETFLRQYVAEGKVKSPDDTARQLFAYFEKQRNLRIDNEQFDENILEKIGKLPAKVYWRHSRKAIIWGIAAGLVLICSLGFLFRDFMLKPHVDTQMLAADTYSDPQKAYEETKKALLFISSKLNEGVDYTSEISKFEEAQEKIKTK